MQFSEDRNYYMHMIYMAKDADPAYDERIFLSPSLEIHDTRQRDHTIGGRFDYKENTAIMQRKKLR